VQMKLFKIIFIFLFSLLLGSNYAQWNDGTPFSSGNGLDATPSEFLNNGYAVKCDGGSDGQIRVTVTSGTGPFYYDWGNGDEGFGTSVPLQMVFEPSSTKPAGTYQVTIYDTGNDVGGDPDEITLTISILSPPALIFKSSGFGVSQNNPSCNYNTDGSISSKAQGGIGSYSYLWDDAGATTSRTISGIGHGTYIVSVTDGNLCTASKTYTIDQPTAVIPNLEITSEGCDGASGIITAVPTGGSGVYSTYSWDDASSQTTNPATGLTPGTYTVTVTDNSVPTGCIGTESITLNSPTAITSSTSETVTLCSNSSDGTSTITVSGGLAP